MNLIKEAEKLGLAVSENANNLFAKYSEMLISYNKVMNLTAITEPDEVKEKHFLDSITLILSEKLENGMSLIDIGAGAGFPSLPVKIVRDDLNVTMLDSLNKRIGFLNDVINELGLKNIQAVHFRAEDAGKDKNFREKFDIATARAVADLAVLSEYALPFVKVGGCFVALKGNSPKEETEKAKKAIREMGGEIEEIKEVRLPSGIVHSLVIVRKVIPTPDKYPRKAGTPVKKPII